MKMFSSSLYIAVAICLVPCMAEHPIPDYLHICHENDPNLTGCMITSIETLRPKLVTGIPDLNIPSIEPMDIGNLLVSEATQSNGLRITAKNIRAFGASTFKIKSLEVVEYGQIYNAEVFFPKLEVEGTYEVNGQVLLLPIRGTGPFKGNFTDSTGSVRMQFARKENSDLVTMKKFVIKIKVGKGKVRLFNLFNGDKALGDAVNGVLNENFDVVSKDIIPLVERALQRLLKRISSRILENFTYDQIFPK
ncbi:circadian clock-controlled protein daywake-like [Sitodiplosis mosellana]|uniref:circadian clock-controlled protein daywake-like n=1 Tax=Sitodiplosis mosellana TaxID=263140 RepID=UPI002445096E|nr:circadian clock-controlled protein daywake-like [Sitodiplosis mosellana]